MTLEPNLNNTNSVQFLTKTISVMSRTLVAVADGQAEETQQEYEADFVIRRMDRPLLDDSKSALSLPTIRIGTRHENSHGFQYQNGKNMKYLSLENQ